MSRIKLQSVSKRFGAIDAVNDLSLTVPTGVLFTLVGPSGCGKTTTLRLIAGFESPTSGDIAFDGHSVIGTPPESRNVGVVFENYALFPHLTVSDNIGYGLKFTDRFSNPSARVQEMLNLVGLRSMGNRRPPELSAGQQQRVALARALCPAPDLLLLDEPLSALDRQLRERLKLEIAGIQQDLNLTTLYVTHNQREALSIADQIAVMHRGALEQINTPSSLYQNPATEFVAKFIGKGNLLQATVTKTEKSRITLDLGDQQTLEIHSNQPLNPGQRVKIVIRPEKLEIDEHGLLSAELNNIEYLGEYGLAHLKLGDQELIVTIPPRQISELKLLRNQPVSIQVQPDQVTILK